MSLRTQQRLLARGVTELMQGNKKSRLATSLRAERQLTHGLFNLAGWLGVLKSWCEGKNSKLAVTAARVLNNLDRDWTSEVLEDGIVILHPLHRSRSVWCVVCSSVKLILLVSHC